jgi:hypothetical protein
VLQYRPSVAPASKCISPGGNRPAGEDIQSRTREDAAASDDTVEPDTRLLGEFLELLASFDLRFNIVEP